VYIPVLTANGVRYNNVDLFPDVQGDRLKNAPPDQILQSVITFSYPEVGDWLKTNEAGLYRVFLDYNYNNKKVTSLPAPLRQCRMCAVGKSMLLAPRVDPQAAEIWSAKLNELRNGIIPHAKVSGNSQESFVHEISWLNSEVLADFATVGICAPCPAGTYFNDAYADLATTVVGSQERLDVIKKMNEGPRKQNPLLAQWKLKQLRCVPCEAGTYRSAKTDTGTCVLATDEAVVLLDEMDLRWQESPGTTLKVSKTLLAIRAQSCPLGSEKQNLDKTCTLAGIDMDTLAGNVGNRYVVIKKNDCCRPCAVNFYKIDGQTMCTNVDSNKATTVPYGNTQQITCTLGTELHSCKEKKVETNDLKFKPSFPDLCVPSQDITSEDDDWRVCLECTAVERPEEVDLEPRCVMCNGDGEDFEALGEFYNKETKQCESCDDCSVFEPKVEWQSFFATDADYKNAMSQWLEKSSRLESYRVENRWHYKHFDITNACKELQRRVLSWDATTNSIQIDGDDRVKVQAREKWKGQLFGEGAVAAFHAVDYERFLDGARRCAARRCETFCDMWYKYSQGCGAGAARADLWVRSADAGAWQALRLVDLEARLRTLAGGDPSGAPAAAELAQWQLKHHGQCVECTLCADGQYNPECNAFAQGVRPEGRCEGCTTQCEGGEFLWHRSGLRGCAPLVDELRGRVLTDYVCRRCPTWVRRAERMYAVLGCGFKDTFQWWRTATYAPQYDTLTKAQALAKAAYEHPQVDVKFKPFWHLGAYCPDGHFFNPQEKDCAFRAESGFALHHAEMSFGYEAFRLECCQLCDTCDADRYRMTAQYAECTGESMIDTQAKGCGDRCESGFYVKNETALECVACTEC